MAEIKIAYMYVLYERIWLKSLHVMSSIKFFVKDRHTDGLVGQTNTTDWPDPYDNILIEKQNNTTKQTRQVIPKLNFVKSAHFYYATLIYQQKQ